MDSLTANFLAEAQVSETQEDTCSAASKKRNTFESLAQELFSSSDSSLKKLCEIISRDVAPKAEVISLANAFIFSFGRPVRSLSQAIACLGYDRCRKIIAVRLGAECAEKMESDQQGSIRSRTESNQRLPGVRPYRRKRLSSLYPPKNRGPRPHFLSGEQGQT